MRKFIINIVLFAIIILAIFILIELALFLRPNNYSYKRNYVETHLDEIQTLLLGNSHIEEALIPDSMSKGTFNMAISGRELLYDIEIAKRYIPLLTNLRCVVIQLNYTGFHFGRGSLNAKEERKNEDRLMSTYKCMYYKYMGLRVDPFWYWPEALNSKIDFMSRFFMNDDEARECDSLGYVVQKKTNRHLGWESNNLPQIIDTLKPIDKTLYNQFYNSYLFLSELTYKKNIKLILLGTPMYKTYRDFIIPKVQDEIDDFVGTIQCKYSNVYYLNYTADKRFLADDFFDSSHLSDYGAIKFSKILNEDLKRLDNKE